MTDKEKLLKLADYFDAMDALHGNPRSDVQKDLRRIAESLEAKDAEIERLRKALASINHYAKAHSDTYLSDIAEDALEGNK